MDACAEREYVLDDMARKAGIAVKVAYPLREVVKASGVPYSTIAEHVRDGRLRTFLPPGQQRGHLVKSEWFERWWEEGCS